ncbi:MAG: NifB/NifX family molybdenum-iron cluster-binding protein [Candidatus Thorarchaeota archaeon]
MKKIIGIPSDGSETSANISAHFGHCNYFVGIEIYDNNKYKKSFALPNNGHSGCMEPVINMKQRNVTDMILTGIGMRPFMGFQQVNVNLYQGVHGSIEKNIQMFLEGELRMLTNSSCESNSNHAHTH